MNAPWSVNISGKESGHLLKLRSIEHKNKAEHSRNTERKYNELANRRIYNSRYMNKEELY